MSEDLPMSAHVEQKLFSQHSALSERVTGIETTVVGFKEQMGGFKDQLGGLSNQIQALVNQLSNSNKTDWGVLATCAGIIFAVCGAVIMLEKQPLELSESVHEQQILELKADSIRRADLIGDEKLFNWRLQQIEENAKENAKENDRLRRLYLDNLKATSHK